MIRGWGALATGVVVLLITTPSVWASVSDNPSTAPPTGSVAPDHESASAAGADQIQWGISPQAGTAGARSAFDFVLAPGQSVADSVTVSNLGGSPVTLAVYATDALNTSDGAFTLLTAAEQPTDAGSWIALDKRTVVVEPGKQVDIAFTVRVPAKATPGDHAAGIVASRMVDGTGGNNATVAVDQRVGSRVYLRVDGPLTPALDVTGLSAAYSHPWYPFGGSAAVVDYQLTNAGNVRLNGTAEVRLTGPFGIALGSPQTISITQLLPGSSLFGTVTVAGVIPLGSLTAHLEVDAVGGTSEESIALPTVSASHTVTAIPWLIVGIVLLLTVIAVLRLRSRRRMRRKTAAASTDSRSSGAGDAAAGDDAGQVSTSTSPPTTGRSVSAAVPPTRGSP